MQSLIKVHSAYFVKSQATGGIVHVNTVLDFTNIIKTRRNVGLFLRLNNAFEVEMGVPF